MVFLFVIVHRFCCLHSRPPQGRGSVRGEPLTGSPTRVQSPARRRATRKAPKRRLRRMKQGAFEEVSRLSAAIAGGSRLTRRGSLAALPRRDTHTGTKTCPRHVFLAALVPFRASARDIPKRKHHPDGWCFLFWSGRRGSNSLPRPWQGRALPDELRPQTAPLLRHLGASGRSRTNDTRIFSPLLYQLSYRGIWRPRRGSNPRPPA